MDNNEKTMNTLLEGLELYRKRQFVQAKTVWEQALAINPHDFNALHFLGMAYSNLGQFDQAIVLIDKAITINPQIAEMHNHRGSILQALKRFEDAITSHNRAIELNPNLAAAYTNRGNAFQQLKLFEAAIFSHDYAIALQPDFSVAHTNRKVAIQALQQSLYHRADPKIVEYWRSQLGQQTKPRVGLIWNHQNDDMNYSLADWIPYLPPQLQYICLQKEISAADQLTINFYPELFVNPHFIHPFDDKEALCELMDLIISTDTLMAYFVATIDKPLWLLLSQPKGLHYSNFNWKRYFDKNNIYHSIKLYDDYPNKLSQIAADLERCNKD